MAAIPHNRIIHLPSPFAFILWLALTCSGSFANNLFETRQASIVFRGGIAFGQGDNPFAYPADSPFGKASLQIPFSKPDPPGDYISPWADSTTYLPRKDLEVSQKLMPAFSAGVPLFEGLVFLSFRENTSLDLYSNIESARFHLDTASAGEGQLRLHGEYASSLQLSHSWRTFTLGYRLKAGKKIEVAFLLNKHFYQLEAHGNYYGEFSGELRRQDGEQTALTPVRYGTEDFRGELSGKYSGQSWAPELGIRFWKFRYQARFGTKIPLSGFFRTNNTTPFFLDNLTLGHPKRKVPNYFSEGFADSLLRMEKRESSFSTEAAMSFDIPQVHTLEAEMFEKLWFLSWTTFSGTYDLSATPDSASASPYDARVYAGFSAAPDHLVLLRREGSILRISTGFFLLPPVPVPGNKVTSLMQEYSLEIPGMNTYLVPVLEMGLSTTGKVGLGFNLSVFPVAQLRTGISYVF